MERRDPWGLAVRLAGFIIAPLVDAEPERSSTAIDGRRTISTYLTRRALNLTAIFLRYYQSTIIPAPLNGACELTRACAFRYDESRVRALLEARQNLEP